MEVFMAKILPFKALRYNTDRVDDLSCMVAPPYDVISPKEQEALYGYSPYNVIRLEYGNHCEDINEDNNRYVCAKADLDNMLESGILRQEGDPALYIYEQVFTLPSGAVKKCTGLFTLVELTEFSQKIVLPHEETLSKAKTDRFNLMKATNCNFSPVYCLYLDEEREAYKLIKEKTIAAPDVSFVSREGITQNLWIIKDNGFIEKMTKIFAGKQLFIADGHHRYETALNYRNYLREQGVNADGANNILMVLVDMDDEGLVIFPTHRIVKNLKDFNEEKLIASVSEFFTVKKLYDLKNIAPPDDGGTNVSLYVGGDYFYLLALRDKDAMGKFLPDKSDAYRSLDVSVLHTLILERDFGIDPMNMASQSNLLYTREINEAVSAVSTGEAQCAFILNATGVREIKDVSLANEKMPQKSTYFYPKIITGLVMNKL